jgi:hypothetical protein
MVTLILLNRRGWKGIETLGSGVASILNSRQAGMRSLPSSPTHDGRVAWENTRAASGLEMDFSGWAREKLG